jgi:hypothetical protein
MFLLVSIARRLFFVAIALAIPLVAGEFLARTLVSAAVKNAIVARIGGGKAQIGFGSTPVLLQLVHGNLNDVSVSEKHAHLGDLPSLSFNATLTDVHLASVTHLQGAIGAITAQAHLDSHAVRDLLATPACVNSLAPDLLRVLCERPRVAISAGHVTLRPPHGDAVVLALFPAAVGHTIYFHVTGLVVDGTRAARATLDSVAASVNCARTVTDLPFGLALQGVSAKPHTLELDFGASNASFSTT